MASKEAAVHCGAQNQKAGATHLPRGAECGDHEEAGKAHADVRCQQNTATGSRTKHGRRQSRKGADKATPGE
eukprot:12452626-Alexandrium_andersonii.AAC.1